MVVLALILLLLVAVVVVSAVLAGDGPATLNLVGADIVTTERTLFLAGVVSTAVAGLALWLLVKGLKRARSRRAEMHRLRDAAARSSAPEREDRGTADSNPDTTPRTGHPSTGPGRGVRSPTDPGEYRGPTSRRGDDERDHFESLPRD
jgi:hypothetical protein